MLDYNREFDKRFNPAALEHEGVWEEKPVSLKEFYETFFPEPLFPIQQEMGEAALGTDPLEWDGTYDEIIALFGKGSGKDRTAAKVLVYVCYKLLCMREPWGYFGLGVNDKIEVGNVSVNARLAKDVFFKYFTTILRACKNPKTGKNWFEEKGLSLREDILTREVHFPKNITAYSLDSEVYTGEGLNLFFVILDEIAGFNPATAHDLYTALRTTARSRFPRHMKLILLSYKRSDADYMMTRYNAAEHEPRTWRRKAATWEVNLRRSKDEFAEDYIRDPEGSQRIYECEGTTSEGGFIKYKDRIGAAFNREQQNPVLEDKTTVIDLRTLQFKDWFKPLPNTQYFIHIDLAKGDREKSQDACGFAMGHYTRNTTMQISQEHIDKVRDLEGFELGSVGGVGTLVTIDLALQIRAPAGGEILFEDVRDFIHRLRKDETLKFPIALVTFDGYQSVDSIQQLRKSGMAADELSVDRDNRAYNQLKSNLYTGLLKGYYHPVLIRELMQIELTKAGKVDHPEGDKGYSSEEGYYKPSKDVADAVAGVVVHCVERGKTEFKFWTGNLSSPKPGEAEKNPARFESEKLIRYGERPPEWYKKR